MKTIEENVNKTFSHINAYINEVVCKSVFYIPFVLSIIISYGFTLFNRTVFIDDMAQDVYYGPYDHKLKALRWGQYITDRIFSTVKFTPFLNRFIGLLFLIVTVVLFGAILYYFDKKKDDIWKYSVFSGIFISYPLITEFFGFFEALTIPLQFAIVSFALFYQVLHKERSIKDHIFIGILLSFVMAGYESLIFAYITEVFIVLFIEYVLNDDGNHKTKDWIIEGFSYAIPLFIALILKYVIGYLILFVTGLEYARDGNTSIHWISDGILPTLIRVLFNGYFYVLRGLSFLPITVFVITLFAFIIIAVRHQRSSRHSLLISFFLLASLFFLSILQGDYLGYRQCQSLHLFVAYVFYVTFDEIYNEHFGRLSKRNVLIFVSLFLILRQRICTHVLFALDNQRSDNEAYVVQNIGYRLYSEFDTSKTVIFCGLYDMGEFINSQIYPDENSIGGRIEEYLKDKYGYSHINVPFTQNDNIFSTLNWAHFPFYGQTMYKNVFSYYGYDINVLSSISYEKVKEYTKFAEDNGMKTFEIRDFGDYILVYLGPATRYTNWNI